MSTRRLSLCVATLLATAVVKTGEDVWYSGDTSNLAPQVEAALDAYVDESHTKAIAEQEVLKENNIDGLLTCALRPHLIWGAGALIIGGYMIVALLRPEKF